MLPGLLPALRSDLAFLAAAGNSKGAAVPGCSAAEPRSSRGQVAAGQEQGSKPWAKAVLCAQRKRRGMGQKQGCEEQVAAQGSALPVVGQHHPGEAPASACISACQGDTPSVVL